MNEGVRARRQEKIKRRASEAREAAKKNQVRASEMCYRRAWERRKERKARQERLKQTEKPQTRRTGLIDGDEQEGDGQRLLKESAANNLPWVHCVKSISTASKAATVIGIPY